MRHARKDYNGRIVDTERLIPADEPVFLLRGQDLTAPNTLRYWAQLQESRRPVSGCKMVPSLEESGRMANMAREWATEMEQWQNEHGRKWADAPDGAAPLNEEPFPWSADASVGEAASPHFGPPRVGEAAAFIFRCNEHRGMVVAIRDGGPDESTRFCYIAVLGYPATFRVEIDQARPLRDGGPIIVPAMLGATGPVFHVEQSTATATEV